MKRRVTILRTFGVGALAIALTIAAFSGGTSATVASATAANDASGSAAAEHLNVDVSGIAAQVVSALIGGENPSTDVANRASNEKAKGKSHDADTDEATETEVEANEVSNGLHVGQVGSGGTTGTRPGFGCGDKNHEHSGPPGRPSATLPPGCTKNH